MRLIDADALRKPIYAEEDNITGSGMTYAEMDGYNDGVDAAWSRIKNTPTIDAVPVDELLKLRDWLYESDGITMGGLRSLNELIVKYSSNLLPRIENGFERRST